MWYRNNNILSKIVLILMLLQTYLLSPQLKSATNTKDSAYGSILAYATTTTTATATNNTKILDEHILLPTSSRSSNNNNALTNIIEKNSTSSASSSSSLMSLPAAAAGSWPPGRLQPPPRVKLNKCCNFNEYLNANKECVAGSTSLWVPMVYLLKRRHFHTKGLAPDFMTFNENTRPLSTSLPNGCQNINDLELFNGSGKLILFSNGSLFLQERAELIEPSRYCVDMDAALVCFPTNNQTAGNVRAKLKLHKCCGKNGSYDVKLKSCILGAEYAEVLTLPAPHNENVQFQTIYGFPTCPSTSSQPTNAAYAIVANVEAAHLEPETGALMVAGKNLSSNEYCLEHMRHDNAVKIFTCLHHFGQAQVSHKCPLDALQRGLINGGLVISGIFLAATLVANYMMPSAHHLLHWRCQIYYVFCLFVGDNILAYTNLQLHKTLELGSVSCLFLASAMHFFFLAAFFWLNTMCFNIWWTFRDFRPTSLERNQEVLRLRLYSAYAWGIPFLITFIAFVIDQLPETNLLQPGFGLCACWFNGEKLSIFAYFFGPIGILLCINIVLFVSTTHMLTCGLWKRDDIKSTTEKTQLGKVCVKLVVVMGVTWIAEIISWLVGEPCSLWFFTELINALQGVFIFIVVGCQPQVWTAFKRCCWSRSRHEITNTTNGVQHSSSSQGLPSLAACGGDHTQNTSMNNSAIGTTYTTSTADATDFEHKIQTTKIPMETVC